LIAVIRRTISNCSAAVDRLRDALSAVPTSSIDDECAP
jgi:hypothetical protein